MIKRIFILYCIAIAAVITASNFAHSVRWDISQNKLNTLSSASKNLLQRLDSRLTITVASADVSVMNIFEDILDRYKKYSKYVTVKYNTKTNSEKLEINYKNHQKSFGIDLTKINEQQISVLIQQVIQKSEHWLVFLTGHEETDPFSKEQYGLSNFTNMIKDSGLYIAELNLIEQQSIPSNVGTLVIANPQTTLTTLEQNLLHDYIFNGGNVWLFTEPGSPINDFLLSEFGVGIQPGVIVDPSSLPLGSPHPALKLLTSYPEHSINANLKSATVMPWSAGLQIEQMDPRWSYEKLLQTHSEAWAYTGPETSNISVMREHIGNAGPLNIGLALSNNQQRILLVADSSFITNKYISMYANSTLIMNMLHWLDQKAEPKQYEATIGIDFSYCPSKIDRLLYNYVWIFIAPLLLCLIGFCMRARYTDS